jgi:phosphatidylglycerophosphatase GEP4
LTSYDPSGELARQVEATLGISVLMHRQRKPLGSAELLKHFSYNSDQIAVVGDRVLTDVLYANVCGMRSILVKDIITEDGDDAWAIKVFYFR